jgi:hypothetical protein
VYVTIAHGDIHIAQASVAISDEDADGALTINDALIAAHDQYYKDGTDGFGSEMTSFGLSLTRLWGDESGNFGYAVNNVPAATDLTGAIKAGDHIYAYIYTDATTFSDMFSYFDQSSVQLKAGEELTLTLNALSYDENWALVASPVKGATILINGKDSGVVTDAQGKATIKLNDNGSFVLSATHADMLLVPPVCTVAVK